MALFNQKVSAVLVLPTQGTMLPLVTQQLTL